MNPWFIVGFTDSEGCFSVSVYRNNTFKTGLRIILMFTIVLHLKDKMVLELIHNHFKVGRVTKQGAQAIRFRVDSLKDLAVIIEFFDKYSLISQKRSDYELFKQIYYLMLNKEHLTKEGLRKIVAIKASMNLGLSLELKSIFSDVIPVKRPDVDNVQIENPSWLTGFTSGDGCFSVKILKSTGSRLGWSVQLVFIISQHFRDKQLMLHLIEYFNCGNLYRNKEIIQFGVQKLSDIENKIIPFFNKYPIIGIKSKDFDDWCKVAEMMKQKKHLTAEGLAEIRKIKDAMNTGRK